jgi:hypothetical protein
MAAQRLLRKDAAPIDLDLEHAAGGLDELDLGMRIRAPNLGRQTGGPWLVVSDDAELDRNLHGLNDSRA